MLQSMGLQIAGHDLDTEQQNSGILVAGNHRKEDLNLPQKCQAEC